MTGREERGRAIRVARAHLGLKQSELADLAGLDQTTVSKAERGEAADATYDTLERALVIAADTVGAVDAIRGIR